MHLTLIALALLGLIALATSDVIKLENVPIPLELADDTIGVHDNSGDRKTRQFFGGGPFGGYGGYGGFGGFGGYGGYGGFGGYGHHHHHHHHHGGFGFPGFGGFYG